MRLHQLVSWALEVIKLKSYLVGFPNGLYFIIGSESVDIGVLVLGDALARVKPTIIISAIKNYMRTK